MKKSYIPSVAAALILFACGQPTDKQAELTKLKAEYDAMGARIRQLESELPAAPVVAGKAKAVVTETLARAPFVYFVETQAGVEAEENIMVSPRSGGLVTQVYVKEGQAVKAGQVIAQLDNSLTQKAIAEVQASLDLARTVYDRQKSLWDQKIGTEIQFLTARTNKESLERRLASLQEQDDLSRVRSAIAGTVDDVMIKVGENAAPGMPAARIVSTRRLKVVANLSEAYVNQIQAGQDATVILGGTEKEFKGRVAFTGKNINPLSRSFAVEIPVPASTDARPGMSARVRVDFKKVPDALSVPVNLVQKLNGEQVVFVAAKKDNSWVAQRRKVEVGGIYGNRAEILSGLQPGDQIITVAYQGLNEGEAVEFPQAVVQPK